MITEAEWNRMSEGARADAWFAELAALLKAAAGELHYLSGNAETEVTGSGLTTIVSRRGRADA